MSLVSNVFLALAVVLWVLLLPGLVWSFVFFAKGDLDVLERLMVSFGIGIALVPICLFAAAYYFAVELTVQSVSGVVVLLLGAGTLVIVSRYWLRRRGEDAAVGEPGGPPDS